MKDNLKGYILVVVAVVAAVVGYLLYSGMINEDFQGYWIICVPVCIVALGFGIKFIIDTSSPSRAYESNVRNILNTFDSILVQSNAVPKLEGRNIINVESIDDLVDAQLEIRKPICYYKQTESCSFALLDDKEAYIYIEKLNPDVVSPLEIEIKENKLKNKSQEEMDSEMLRDIEKTTIVKLSNKKSYKVSPIRKDKKKEEVKEDKFEIENDKKEEKKGFSKSDEIEIL